MLRVPYQLIPRRLGAEVTGIDLGKSVPQEVVEKVKSDVTEHRLLIFKKQSPISGERHVEISHWFGELESTFYKHPRSPHPDVFRVSNVESEGCRGVGRTGWHIDGSFQPAPFGYSLYYMHAVPLKGDTVFAPLHEILMGLPSDQLARWERLYMVSDRRGGLVHPLVYSHPKTLLKTMCFHLGMTEAFIWDYGTERERFTDYEETARILEEIHHEFVKDNKAIQYSHKWEVGDFIISDNLAVGHEATPETQLPVEQVGLRVLHRTTVKGTVPPTKRYKVAASSES
ncbi:(3R)-3-[(carboxymethyl)amino]fatty acid oxygenase/decarboxylase-like [Diadema setosum]|uniref:(3R)-3-[(carboxymethyl)amino]fatty acid oxygenase/decarboxylase-like n=1 Tax=Diadema setosum TaxID=31175 RepID=UPI003B3A9A5D